MLTISSNRVCGYRPSRLIFPGAGTTQNIQNVTRRGALEIRPCWYLLLISAFVCLLLALQWAGINYRWSDSRVLGCLLGFGLLTLTFLGIQVWRKDR